MKAPKPDVPQLKHGGMNPRGKKELHHLEVMKGADGGHIVGHHFEDYSQKPEMHPFEDHEGPKPKLPEGHVLQHIAHHMGIPHEMLEKGKEGDGGDESQQHDMESDTEEEELENA